MQTLNEDEELEAFLEENRLVGFGFGPLEESQEDAILRRASHRLSAMLPKKLRFSEAWALKKVQLRNVGAGRNNATFRADSAAGSAESGPLKVYVRLRPCNVRGVGMAADKMEEAIKPTSDCELALEPPANAKRMFKPLPTEHFTYTKVFPSLTKQEHYFKTTTVPLVEDMLSFKFKNSVVVAYGSSGAGKTYTIEGPPDDPGVLPRAVHQIFKSLEEEKQQSLQQQQQPQQQPQKRVLVSFFEVYNDLVYDLLSGCSQPSTSTAGTGTGGAHPQHTLSHTQQPSSYQQQYQQHLQQFRNPGQGRVGPSASAAAPSAGAARNVLRVREDGAGRVLIPGLSEVPCNKASDALDLHKRAARMRQQACTGINSTSSRSHCVFSIKLEEAVGSREGRSSSLSFVDLAGSERLGRTGNTGNRLKESLAINSSLMVLGRCIETLKQNQSAPPGAPLRVIPFRESKITHLFKDVLHGWGHLVLSVCVSPVAGDFDETCHVLRYAALATNISMAGSSGQPAQGAGPSIPPNTHQAAENTTGGVSSSTSSSSSLSLRARVDELETELARVYDQLQEAETHLTQAEAGIRDEVVGEIQDVIRELRGTYEERMEDLVGQLAQKDECIQHLERQLQEAGQRQQQQQQQQVTSAAVPVKQHEADQCHQQQETSILPVELQQQQQQQQDSKTAVPIKQHESGQCQQHQETSTLPVEQQQQDPKAAHVTQQEASQRQQEASTLPVEQQEQHTDTMADQVQPLPSHAMPGCPPDQEQHQAQHQQEHEQQQQQQGQQQRGRRRATRATHAVLRDVSNDGGCAPRPSDHEQQPDSSADADHKGHKEGQQKGSKRRACELEAAEQAAADLQPSCSGGAQASEQAGGRSKRRRATAPLPQLQGTEQQGKPRRSRRSRASSITRECESKSGSKKARGSEAMLPAVAEGEEEGFEDVDVPCLAQLCEQQQDQQPVGRKTRRQTMRS